MSIKCFRSKPRLHHARVSAERRRSAFVSRSPGGRNACHEARHDCVHRSRAQRLWRQIESGKAGGPSIADAGKRSLAAAGDPGRAHASDPSLYDRAVTSVNFFAYKNGQLCAEDVPLSLLAEQAGTPFYCYSTAALTHNYSAFAAALPRNALIAFSVKANGNVAVLKTLARLGAGADVVSGGELKKALAAGIPGDRIVFSGVGKAREEMRDALVAGIHQFNVESEPAL